MRTISSQVLPFLKQQYGSEPIIILEVSWSGDRNHRIAYSDQRINNEDYPYPSIISLDDFETSITLSGANESQSTSVKLSDTDGQLKTIMDNNDIHKCPCWIYQTFKGLPYTERILLFQGEITTPINWNEGDRTLSFDISSIDSDTDVAFSMEEGDFPSIPETALGKVWPLVFGTVCNMQAVQVRSPRVGYLTGGEGIHDFTLEARICQAHYLMCKSVVIGTKVIPNGYYVDKSDPQPIKTGFCISGGFMGGECYNTGWSDPDDQAQGWWFGDTFIATGPSAHQKRAQDRAIEIRKAMEDNVNTIGDLQVGLVTYLTPPQWNLQEVADRTTSITSTMELWGVDLDCVEDRFITICELDDLLDKQKVYEHSYITIQGGDKFPQHKEVTIVINGAIFIGSFSGNLFSIKFRQHPEVRETAQIQCHSVETITEDNYELQYWNSTWTMTLDQQSWFVPPEYHSKENCDAEPVWVKKVIDGPAASQKALDDMPTSSFCWLPAGSEVYLEDETEVLYIVSLIPGTVNSISAYKKQVTTGRELLMTVPTDLYTVYETDYNGYTVVEIGFDQLLSTVDENWTDDIYVSFTSDVGPNPIDVIDWLITKYTNLTFDPISKAAVKTYLTNYPVNFAVKSKLTLMQLISDIAYQSRCAIYIRDNTLYIVYLALEPTSIRTLTTSDILFNTLSIESTPTEDVYTKQIATWKMAEAHVISTTDVNNKIVLKYNVSKYGINEEESDYYTQNTYSTILKSATFWLIRHSNVWKKLIFDTPIIHLDLDLFDCITIDVSQISSIPIKCVITSITYNIEAQTVHFECLTPIRLGETTEYPFFWPANLDAAKLFPPTAEEAIAGAGYPFIVTPPIGHILLGGSTYLEDQTHVTFSSGDQHPSDIGDTFPTIECQSSSVMDLVEPDPVIEAIELAKKANVNSAKTPNTPPKGEPAGTGGSPDKECSDCGVKCDQYTTDCTWKVTVSSVNRCQLQRNCGNIERNEACQTSAPGGYCCKGELKECCKTFNSRGAAEGFRAAMLAQIENGKVTCKNGTVINTSDILSVGSVEVKYGKNMKTTEPVGGWLHDKESDLCAGQMGGSSMSYLFISSQLGEKCSCFELWDKERHPC